MVKTSSSIKHLFLFVKPLLKSFKLCLFVMFFVSVVWAVDQSLRPYVLKMIIDGISNSSRENVFASVGLLSLVYFLILFFCSSMMRLYGYFVEIKMIPNMRKHIADNCVNLLFAQSYTYYQNNFAGSLANKVNDLTSSIVEIIEVIIYSFFSHFLALIIAVFTLSTVNLNFSLLVLVWVSVLLLGIVLISKKITLLASNWAEAYSIITARLVDSFSNILSVKLFAKNNQEKLILSKTFIDATLAEQKMQWAYFWAWLLCGYSFVSVQGVSLYLLLVGRQKGLISVGDFVVVLSINQVIITILWDLTKDFSQFSKKLGRALQALAVITLKPEITDDPKASKLIVTKGKIVFRNITFFYKNTNALFSDKSLVIEAAQKVGLVGYSGGGKSSFVNLILRLYDLNGGQILIDDQDIAKVTQESLRENIALIPQEPSLFHRTLMENIRYGRSDATEEEIIEASKKAHAHDFIIKLKDGYNSLVGERGIKLSGGQRQRIAIARAILKNAPILLLDEATSQLDSMTEKFIQQSIFDLMQQKTSIVIAHRLSTLLTMDRILVFDQGRIIQDGSHEALLRKPGLYKTLWEAQIGGFLPQDK